ncbi:MAG: carbon-nitrogen hydrolase family protein [Oscillospiraceae bacterium]|nr:carbon-nitrogen hydrolase family protein [Oscillospiraceae bacterium]
MKIAQIQMTVTGDKSADIRRACDLIRSAGDMDLAILPEMFCCPYDNACFRDYGEPAGGEAYTALSALAKERGIYLVGGSVPELTEGKVYNTCYVFDPQGQCIARHRKTHLFDIDVEGGQRFCESDVLTAGRDVTNFETPWGTMGVCICFDFRFSELSRLMALRGAQVIFVPAAFNMTTGPAHWQLLFRQRAVDNQCFTVGTSPARDVNASYVAWGHSIICDPWGSVVSELDEGEHIAVTDLDLSRVSAIRRQLPILSARREDLYEIKEKTQ